LGLAATGVDASSAMILEARRLDPAGRYELYDAKDPLPFADQAFDCFFSSWVVLEQPDRAALHQLIAEAARILAPGGRGFIVANTPEFYSHSWLSCDVGFPENSSPLRSGQLVKARLLPEAVVVTDRFWSDDDYQHAIRQAGLTVAAVHYPKAPL